MIGGRGVTAQAEATQSERENLGSQRVFWCGCCCLVTCSCILKDPGRTEETREVLDRKEGLVG